MLECNGKHGKEWTRAETVNEWIHAARGKGWKVNGQVEQAPQPAHNITN